MQIKGLYAAGFADLKRYVTGSMAVAYQEQEDYHRMAQRVQVSPARQLAAADSSQTSAALMRSAASDDERL